MIQIVDSNFESPSPQLGDETRVGAIPFRHEVERRTKSVSLLKFDHSDDEVEAFALLYVVGQNKRKVAVIRPDAYVGGAVEPALVQHVEKHSPQEVGVARFTRPLEAGTAAVIASIDAPKPADCGTRKERLQVVIDLFHGSELPVVLPELTLAEDGLHQPARMLNTCCYGWRKEVGGLRDSVAPFLRGRQWIEQLPEGLRAVARAQRHRSRRAHCFFG